MLLYIGILLSAWISLVRRGSRIHQLLLGLLSHLILGGLLFFPELRIEMCLVVFVGYTAVGSTHWIWNIIHLSDIAWQVVVLPELGWYGEGSLLAIQFVVLVLVDVILYFGQCSGRSLHVFTLIALVVLAPRGHGFDALVDVLVLRSAFLINNFFGRRAEQTGDLHDISFVESLFPVLVCMSDLLVILLQVLDYQFLDVLGEFLQVDELIVMCLLHVLLCNLGNQAFDVSLVISLIEFLSTGFHCLACLLLLVRPGSCSSWLALVPDIICGLGIMCFGSMLHHLLGHCVLALSILRVHPSFGRLQFRGRCLLLRLDEIIFIVQFLMEHWSQSWKLVVLGNVFAFKAGGNFLLEHHQLILHFGIYIPLLLCRPEPPKGIANNVSLFCFFFNSENIIS